MVYIGPVRIIDAASVLRNIRGFAPGATNEYYRHQNDVWHWFKHCFGFLADIKGVMTLNQYVLIGQEIGRQAAARFPNTYVKVRENSDELLVYWEQSLGGPGLFMVVRPAAGGGEIATLFSPNERKRYFDLQPPVAATRH